MRRALLAALGLGLLLLVGAGALYGPSALRTARVGTGYVAKQMCSCLFVGGGDFARCRDDMLPSMDRISAELLPAPEGEGVRASLPLLPLAADRVALHRPGFGCALQP